MTCEKPAAYAPSTLYALVASARVTVPIDGFTSLGTVTVIVFEVEPIAELPFNVVSLTVAEVLLFVENDVTRALGMVTVWLLVPAPTL